MFRRTHPLLAVVLVAVSLEAVACGATRTGAPPDAAAAAPVQRVDLSETLIQAGRDGAPSKIFELPDLFQEATDYLTADDYPNALRLYNFVIQRFGDPEYIRLSHYNAGLCHEGMGHWAEAAEQYRTVIAGWPATEDAKFAYGRLARCLCELGDFEAVPPVVQTQLIRGDLTVFDELEAHLRLGTALLELRRFTEADMHLKQVIARNEAALRAWQPGVSPDRERPVEPTDPIIGEAHFNPGRIYHELFSAIPLVLPQARLKRDLLEKTELFEQAQDAYLEAVRTGNREWSPAAGFMVGQLFEDFYFDVLATEVPSDFSEVELEVYFEELRNFIRPAMEKARRVYELNLALAQRIGGAPSWTEETAAAIERIREYLETKTGWSQEYALIVAQRHPHSARFADQMHFRGEPSGAPGP